MKFANPDIQFSVEGGGSYTLRLGAVAIAALQDHWKLANFDETMEQITLLEGKELSIGDYTAILWAGLRTHHANLTMDDALEIFDVIGVQGLTLLMVQAASAAFTGGGGTAPGNPPRKAPRRNRGR